MRTSIIGVAVIALAVSASCGKKADDGGAAKTVDKADGTDKAGKADKASPGGSAAGSAAATPASGVTATADPWSNAPADTKTELGSSTGSHLSKITPAPGSTTTLQTKVDYKTIEKPAAQTVEVHAFQQAGAAPGEETPGFSVTYNPSTNATHEQYRQSLIENHVFDKIAESLNKTIRIPHNVAIQTVDCNTVNAFYDPNTSRIIVCYELLDYFINTFKPHAKTSDDLGSAVIGATVFSFYHETGHGLIHQLDLAAVGREEDSVDQLATLILIGEGEKGVQMALSGAYWFQLQTQAGDKTPFWNEHSFDAQRFYNILCLIYGSNPDKYKEFVDHGDLPAERAQRCPEEYRKIHKAWETLLQPYLTNGAATNVDYKPSVPEVEQPKTSKTDPWGDGEAGNSTPTTSPEPGWDTDAKSTPAPAVTCEQVADKAAELITKDALSRAKKPGDKEEIERRLQSALPAVTQKLIAQCAKENWSVKSRQCVLDAAESADGDEV